MLTSNINVLGGIADMPRIPDVMYIVDPRKERIAYSIRKILKIKKHAFHIRNTCSD
ncbi:hypothetical protein EfmAA94_09450 [Enterococcus faecium]|nr:hypothetical protein EfmAA94_09450 [Enterococcus faecium]